MKKQFQSNLFDFLEEIKEQEVANILGILLKSYI